MEFTFNVNRLLPRKINKISHTLIPEDFRGDRRELNECQRLLSRVLDDMGEASANAQGLSKPITSTIKLRDTDHLVYLLVDSKGNNGYGCVVGLLKTGSKNLFMLDENGLHYQLQPRCILDFYVHESKQRMGLGNVLYQHMLAEENTRPVKLAIDRPSEKFLQFLRKHYGLDRIIPQNNKFVVFRGFFDDEIQDTKTSRYGLPPRSITDGDLQGNNNNNNNGYKNGGSNNCKSVSSTSNGAPYSGVSRSAYGRYAAARPPCSMANIIHNGAVLGQAAERTGEIPVSALAGRLERPRSLSLYSEEEQKQRTSELSTIPTPALPDHRAAPFSPEETTTTTRIDCQNSSRHHQTSSVPSALPERSSKRATSAAFGPLVVDHQTTNAFSSMNLETLPDEKTSGVIGARTVKPPSSAVSTAAASAKPSSGANVKPPSAFPSVHRDTATIVEKPSSASNSAGSVKASPSCAQEVSGNQPGHLDLKFYHSPLW